MVVVVVVVVVGQQRAGGRAKIPSFLHLFATKTSPHHNFSFTLTLTFFLKILSERMSLRESGEN